MEVSKLYEANRMGEKWRDKLISRGRVSIAEQTRQMVMENGAMWRLNGNGLKIGSFLEQEKVQNK